MIPGPVDLAEVDILDPSLYENGCPHVLMARMRAEEPVRWNAHEGADGGGVWSLTRSEHVTAVSKDHANFSSAEKGIFIQADQVLPLELNRNVLLYKDPPEHTKYRLILQSAFTPRTVAGMEGMVRERANHLIDAVIDGDGFDFVESIAVPLPLGVLTELLGIPEEDVPKLYEWTEQIEASTRTPEPASAMPVFGGMGPYLLEQVQRQIAAGDETLVTRLRAAEVDGRPLEEAEILTFLILLIFAGNDTTRNTAAAGTLALLQARDQWQLLCERPELVASAVEEILRYTSVVRWFARTAINDVEIGGQRIATGDKVVLWYTSASRDESIYERPDELDITRTDHSHSAFGGGGRHFCLGAGLARLELKVLFGELARRMPGLRLADEPAWLQSNWAGGLTRLPVEPG